VVEPQIVVFAELLVAGIQASVWVVFLAAAVLGTGWISRSLFAGWELLLGLVVLAFVYALGVVVDRIADRVFNHSDRAIRKDLLGEENVSEVGAWRLEVMARKPELAADLSYARSRGRILRATTLNFFLITGTGCLFVLTRTTLVISAENWVRFSFVILLALGLVGISYWSWAATTKTQYTQLRRMHSLLRQLTP
jgi:hypothetical protein